MRFSLKREYDWLNRNFYGNQLPRDLIVQWSARIPRGDAAACHVHGITSCDPKYCPRGCKRSFIRVHPRFKGVDSVASMHVFHETVHVSALLGDRFRVFHGKHFNDEMTRLAVAEAFDHVW